MSVDRLRDSVNTRSQQRGGFKGEGYSHLFLTKARLDKLSEQPPGCWYS